MLITPDRFNKVNQDFLESLIKNGNEEHIHLDYKEQLGSNAEIAKDISSFATNDGDSITLIRFTYISIRYNKLHTFNS